MIRSSVDAFLDSGEPLRPANAVAALLRLADGRYLMQLRDSNPAIFYPDHWGCFGGAVDTGEEPENALLRELQEELGLRFTAEQLSRFTEFTFDFGFSGHGVSVRTYFCANLPRTDLEGIILGEGADFAAFDTNTLLALPRLVPYDAFALWMHDARDRLVRGWTS